MYIEVVIYSCYQYTYSPVLSRILKFLYGSDFDTSSIHLTVEDCSEGGHKNVQAQRRVSDTSIYKGRLIRVYEDDILRHIVGVSNTNYDEDREQEFALGKSNKDVSQYGKGQYHANTYLLQGINQIFKYYFANKDTAKLSFYLLDTDRGHNYPNNLFNVLSYRELETIGFKVLNIDDIDFSEYQDCCKSRITSRNLAFSSLNRLDRDIKYISKKNTGNLPSFLQCEEIEIIDDDGDYNYLTEKYTYTFKSLSAQQYDSLLRCWCLKVLADQEDKPIEFRLGKQYFAFDQAQKKVADKLSSPVIEIFHLAGLNI